MKFDFEKLDVYQKAINFANMIYEITMKFPKSEQFGIVSQLRRAALSISLNIAEGTGRYYSKERKQFYRIAKSSINECIPLLDISCRQRYIDTSLYSECYQKCIELAKMISGLINSLPTKD